MGMGDLSTMSIVITLRIVLFSPITLATTEGAIFVLYVGSIVAHELKQDTTITKQTT
jgi:hypothetical protein